MRNLVGGLVGLVTLLIAKSAWAAFHIMQITEVFPGTTGAPNAQYIEIQMYTGGQNIVGGHKITVHNASGGLVGEYTFAADVANGANQATILIATSEAVTLFNFTAADLAMTPTIPLAGGKVCFENIDCVAWGNYTGGATPSPVGQPAYQKNGLLRGRSLARKLGANATLDSTDDTNQGSDFELALPSPKTNGGAIGTNPASTCGNNTTEGLESCDDNNTTPNDGCSAACVTESCGDGIVQTGEQCDDTNSVIIDGCSNACTITDPQPVDGPPDAPEAPHGDANINPTNNGDGGGCCQTGGPGASPLLALLVLGYLVRRRRVS